MKKLNEKEVEAIQGGYRYCGSFLTYRGSYITKFHGRWSKEKCYWDKTVYGGVDPKVYFYDRNPVIGRG